MKRRKEGEECEHEQLRDGCGQEREREMGRREGGGGGVQREWMSKIQFIVQGRRRC